MNLWQRFTRWMAVPVDGGSLAVLRFAVGLVTALEGYSLLRPRGNTTLLEVLYTSPKVVWHFTYPGFGWVQPISEPWMSLLVMVMTVAGLAVATGFLYRPAVIVAFTLRTYVFLLDVAEYNNHYYLECLLLLYLIFAPASQVWSLDQWWKQRQDGDSTPASRLVPFWSIFLFRAQLFIVYFYGGLTKLNALYLYSAEPMRSVAAAPSVLAPYEPYLSPETIARFREFLAWPQTAYFLSYSGLLFDLAVGFLLVFRRTRYLGFALLVVFHSLNHFLFFDDIAWFPLLGVLSALIFFAPDWPTRFWHVVRHPKLPRPDWSWLLAGAIAIPGIGAALGWQPKPSGVRPAASGPPQHRFLPILLCFWLLFQCLWPLRHLAIAGPVIWTEEGALFSWRMKASLKLGRFPTIHVNDPTLQTIGPNDKPDIDWFSYPGERVVFEDIEPVTVDWSKLPEVMIEFVPLYGERILINPFASGRAEPLSTTEAAVRAQEIWKQAFGRELSAGDLQQTDSVPVAFDFLVRGLRDLKAPEVLVKVAQQSGALYQKLHQTPPESAERQAAFEEYRAMLLYLAAYPQYGRLASEVFARIHPLALWGQSDPQVPFVRVVDPALIQDRIAGAVRIDRDALGRLLLVDPQTVHVPRLQLYTADWASLPKVFVERDADLGVRTIWNPYAELAEYQAYRLIRNPLLMEQYAKHVADLWQEEYGERPMVHVTAYSALPPEPWGLMIDPEADLAAAPRYFLRHNAWIALPGAQAPPASNAAPAPEVRSAE